METRANKIKRRSVAEWSDTVDGFSERLKDFPQSLESIARHSYH